MQQENEFLKSSLHCPHEIPWVDTSNDASRIAAAINPRTASAYTQWHVSRVCDSNERLIEENVRKISDPDSIDYETGRYAGIVCIPIASDLETVDSILPTLHSLVESAAELDLPTLVVPWINYVVRDYRHADLMRSEQYGRAVQTSAELNMATRDMNRGCVNIDLATAIDELPESRPRMSQIRQNAFLAMLGCFSRRWLDAQDVPHGCSNTINRDKRWSYFYDMPLVWCDADTVLGVDALPTIYDSLHRRLGLFISGTIHYAGGVMDYDQGQLATANVNQRLIYASEVLRRQMLDHLPPDRPRGYLPETGMATELGTIASLGGFRTEASTSESYWLLRSAQEALGRWYGSVGYNLHYRRCDSECMKLLMPRCVHEPYVDGNVASRIQAFVRYEKYIISTSIRGTEQMVRHHGRNSLVEFDQGVNYSLWTDGQLNQTPLEENGIAADGLDLLLNAMLSYFKECGGVLYAAQVGPFNLLLDQLCLPSDDSSHVWFPKVLSRGQWPTSA